MNKSQITEQFLVEIKDEREREGAFHISVNVFLFDEPKCERQQNNYNNYNRVDRNEQENETTKRPYSHGSLCDKSLNK